MSLQNINLTGVIKDGYDVVDQEQQPISFTPGDNYTILLHVLTSDGYDANLTGGAVILTATESQKSADDPAIISREAIAIDFSTGDGYFIIGSYDTLLLYPGIEYSYTVTYEDAYGDIATILPQSSLVINATDFVSGTPVTVPPEQEPLAQGPAGATGPIGPVGPGLINWRGIWNDGYTYAINDAVFLPDGYTSFIAVAAGINNPPSNPPPANDGYWNILAQGSIGATGGVESTSNIDGSLTISPTTGAVVASLNVGHANTFSAEQTFSNHITIDGYQVDLSAGAISGQVLEYNGTSFIATSSAPGGVTSLTGGGGVTVSSSTGAITLGTSGIPESSITNLTTDLGNRALTSTAINTTAPLTGGGNLSADRTISIPQASASVDGYLLAADWTTFNSKGIGTIGGSIANTQVAFGSGTDTITGSNNLTWDNTAHTLSLPDGYIKGTNHLEVLTNHPDIDGYEGVVIGNETTVHAHRAIATIRNGPTSADDSWRFTTGLSPTSTGRVLEAIGGSFAIVRGDATGPATMQISNSSNNEAYMDMGPTWLQFGTSGGPVYVESAIPDGPTTKVFFISTDSTLVNPAASMFEIQNPIDTPIMRVNPQGDVICRHAVVDGYTIDISGGAVSGQALTYNGSEFVPVTPIGSVSSVSNSDGSLTISPTTGAVVASINTGHANTFSAKQTFSSDIAVDGYNIVLSGGMVSGQVLTYNGSNIVAATPTTGTITSITASSPLTGGTITSTGTIGIPKADASTDGYLDQATWTVFNNKQPAGSYALTATTISTTAPLTGGGDLSTNRTIAIPKATAGQDGYLLAADWSTFNSKGSGSVTSVATDSSLTGGTITTTGTLGLNLTNANTWTGQQTFNTSRAIFGIGITSPLVKGPTGVDFFCGSADGTNGSGATGGTAGSTSVFTTGNGGSAATSGGNVGGSGGLLSFAAGNGGDASTGTGKAGNGGSGNLYAGNGGNSSSTGNAGTGGSFYIFGGSGGDAGLSTSSVVPGGDVQIGGGNGGPNSIASNGGNVIIDGGTKTGSGTNGQIQIGLGTASTVKIGNSTGSIIMYSGLSITPTTNQLTLGDSAHKTIISSTAPAAASQTATIPDLAGSDTFAFLGQAQTFTANQTVPALLATNTTNQLTLGTSAHKVIISSTAPAGASNTLTISDTAGADTFAMVTLAQTLAGKTLTAPVINGATSSGSTSIDFSNNSGTFLTSTGAVTIGTGAVSISGICTHTKHIVCTGTSPAFAALTKLGSTGSIAVERANDQNARFYLAPAGTGIGTGDLATVTFNVAYGALPIVMLLPANSTAAQLKDVYVDSSLAGSNSVFTITSVGTAPSAGTALRYTYLVIG